MVETASIWQQYCMNGRKREEKKEEKNAINTDLFQPAYTINAYKKKLTAVEDLVSGANEEDVRSFLTAVLAEEEKLYDRLLVYVLNSPGVYALQEYEKVLKKEYPDQILNEYKDEVSKMVVHTSERKNYAHMVSLLRKMQQMKGAKLVEQIVADKSHQDALLNGTLDYDKLVAEYGIIILCRYGENICTL
jgi:hypothetical protein